jgi:WD40 repeat protein
LAGGSPVTLVSRINGAIWGFGAWTDAGEIIFSVTEGGLSRVSADGGTPESLTKVDASRDENRHAFPMFVEGTRTILFSVTRLGAPAPRIEAVQLDTGARQVVVDNAVSARYLDSGHLLFQRDEAILVAPFDRERLVLSGSAVPLVDAVRRDGASSEGRVAQLAVSRDGTLAFIPDANTLQTLVRVERDGRSEPLDLPANQYDKLSVSPNGQYLAVEIVRGRDIEVHVRDFERGTTTRVTPSGGSDAGPSWRPDNRAITATSRTPDGNALFLKELGGAERLIQRVEPGTIVRNTSWSPDGRHLAYTVQRGSEHDIWVLSVGDTVEAQPLLSARYSEHSPSFSPDGRWLAYVSDESGRAEVWVKQYPQGDRFPVSNGGGNGPLWRRDGKEIFFTSPSQVVAVTVAAVGDRLEFGKPTPLFSMRSPGTNGVLEQYATSGNSGRRWDILPDGRFVMARGADVSSTREIVLVQHWFEEVKRLLATR